MTLSHLHIAIVGAGIGGLALARALGLSGARVTVLERAATLGEVGAGLSVWENGLHALEAIGLRGAAEAAGRAWPVYEIHRPGRPAILRDNGALSLRGDVSPLMMHRGALFGLLRDALPPGVAVVPSFALARIEEGRAVATDGRTVAADLIVGADGEGSVVRGHLTDAVPRFRRQVCYRGIVPLRGEGAPVPAEVFGTRHHRAGFFPLPGDALYWFALVDGETPDVPFEAARDGILALGPLAERFVGATPAGAVIASPIRDMPPVTAVHDRIALIGDAAHPMQPSLGQGACLALEDAVVLADSLRRHADDPARGIRAYVERRRRRWHRFHRLCLTLSTGTLDRGGMRRRLAIGQMVHAPRWLMAAAGRRAFAFEDRDVRFRRGLHDPPPPIDYRS